MSFENWLIFASIAFVATATPGPAILLVTTNAMAIGLKYTVVTMLGNISGLFLMGGLSVLGLSAILLHSVVLFTITKFVGAAYLIYLGIKLWKNGFGRIEPDTKNAVERKLPSTSKRYLQGLFIALSNPKAIAFTMALFPQFIDATQPLLPQFSILIVTIMSLSFISLFVYAYTAENVKGSWMASKTGAYISKTFGSAFIVSGIALFSFSQK